MKEAFPDNRFLSTVCSALPSFLPDTRHRISVPSSRSDPRLPAGFCFPQHSSTNRTCCCSSCYTQNHPEHQSENHPPPVVRAVRPPWGEFFPELSTTSSATTSSNVPQRSSAVPQSIGATSFYLFFFQLNPRHHVPMAKRIHPPENNKLHCSALSFITLLGPQSRSGDKPVKFQVVLSPKRDCGPRRVDRPFSTASGVD